MEDKSSKNDLLQVGTRILSKHESHQRLLEMVYGLETALLGWVQQRVKDGHALECIF